MQVRSSESRTQGQLLAVSVDAVLATWSARGLLFVLGTCFAAGKLFQLHSWRAESSLKASATKSVLGTSSQMSGK